MAEERQVADDSSDNSPETFMRSELQNVLQEQLLLGGVSSFDLLPDSDEDPSLSAQAMVMLLEGNTVHVRLSSRGYEIVLSDDQEQGAFEDIEQLLRSQSLLYDMKAGEALSRKLEGLSQDDGDE